MQYQDTITCPLLVQCPCSNIQYSSTGLEKLHTRSNVAPTCYSA